MLTIKEIAEKLAQGPSEEFLEMLAGDSRKGVQLEVKRYRGRIAKQQAERDLYREMSKEEEAFRQAGLLNIAGCDEAGRGPLAGPLVVAAVVLPKDAYLGGLNDSKQVSGPKREELYTAIRQVALGITVSIVGPRTIDRLNIYEATKEAMARCISGLKPLPEVALIDAMKLNIPLVHCKSLIHGDAKSVSIAAASIIAKVTRDRLMVELDQKYPQYGFSGHKGYGSQAHMEAIEQFGPCPWHRRSYEPIKGMNVNNCLGDSVDQDEFLVLK